MPRARGRSAGALVDDPQAAARTRSVRRALASVSSPAMRRSWSRARPPRGPGCQRTDPREIRHTLRLGSGSSTGGRDRSRKPPGGDAPPCPQSPVTNSADGRGARPASPQVRRLSCAVGVGGFEPTTSSSRQAVNVWGREGRTGPLACGFVLFVRDRLAVWRGLWRVQSGFGGGPVGCGPSPRTTRRPAR